MSSHPSAGGEPTEKELLPYGYAAGHYTIRCGDCQNLSNDCDKRAARCHACAVKAWKIKGASAGEGGGKGLDLDAIRQSFIIDGDGMIDARVVAMIKEIKELCARPVGSLDALREAVAEDLGPIEDVLYDLISDLHHLEEEGSDEDAAETTITGAAKKLAALLERSSVSAPREPSQPSESSPQGNPERPARPIKLRTIYNESHGKFDSILIDSYPIGGGVWQGPREIAKEIEYRIRSFEPGAAGQGEA